MSSFGAPSPIPSADDQCDDDFIGNVVAGSSLAAGGGGQQQRLSRPVASLSFSSPGSDAPPRRAVPSSSANTAATTTPTTALQHDSPLLSGEGIVFLSFSNDTTPDGGGGRGVATTTTTMAAADVLGASVFHYALENAENSLDGGACDLDGGAYEMTISPDVDCDYCDDHRAHSPPPESVHSGKITTRYDFQPSVGTHFMQYRGTWIRVERTREQRMLEPWETVQLTTFGRHRELFVNILEESRLLGNRIIQFLLGYIFNHKIKHF